MQACLAKDPDERLQTAHDVKLQLQWIVQAGSQSGVPTHRSARQVGRERLAWLLAGVLALVAIVAIAGWWVRAHRSLPAMYFNSPVPFAANDLALSPDGRTVALVGYWDQANKYVLWRYEVGGRGMNTVQGTEGASILVA